VERGFYTIAELEGIHARLNELLRRQGTSIDAFYYCPHAPERGCACRKPGTELFERARTDFRIDLATSAIVGDRALDAEAGRKLGLLVARIRLPGLGAAHDTEFEELRRPPDITADSVEGAVTRILARG
jgi:D-glycero-D-manno-heptose 1,7-bisphosphate phosphatase